MKLISLREDPSVRLTHHAKRRKDQRGISGDAILAALAWGRKYQQPQGRIAYHLDSKSAMSSSLSKEEIVEYKNVAVVEGKDGAIITVYRSPKVRIGYSQ